MQEKVSILIVDDDESTCKSLSLIFRKVGYETETAGTGKEAIKKARKRFFNIALLDIRLPDMKGVELVAPLKELHPDIIVIMVTGYASMETAMRALNEGTWAYIIKPINIDDVLAKVGEAIDKQHLEKENRQLLMTLQLELAERKETEKKLKHLNLVLRAIRNVNQLITRERNRDKLLKDICSNLIENRGYHSVWIAVSDESGKLVTSTEAGLGKNFKPIVDLLKGGDLTYCARKALMKSDVVVIKDTLSTCKDCPVANKYSERGCMTVRLEYGGKVYGLLSTSIAVELISDKAEHSLFKEVARDVALALHAIELENKRRRMQEAFKVSYRLLEIANRHSEMIPLIQEFVSEIRNYTGCAAVGIRILDENGNIPYKAWEGFSKEFFELEGPISINSNQSICNNVIKGEIDSNLPYFTERGSFFINSITFYLATLSEEEKSKTCTLCNKFGYESVALIPIHLKGNTIGLIHVTDPKKEMVPIEMVEVLEATAMQLGMSIQRVQTQEALRESEQQFSLFMDYLPAIVFIKDEQYRTLYINKYMRDALGDKDWLGKTALELFPKNIGKSMIADDKQTLSEGYRMVVERVPDKNGIEHIYQTQKFIIKRKNNTPLIGGIAQDITERKQAEEALRESEGKYRFLVDNSKAMVFIVDRKGKILFANKSSLATVGYSEKEIIGKSITHFLIKDYVEKAFYAIEQEFLGNPQPGMEVKIKTKSGKIKYLEIARGSTFAYEKGELIGLLVNAQDITERKKAEEMLRRYSEKLEQMVEERTGELKEAQKKLIETEKMALLGQVAAGIGHDLRNPMGIISNAAYYIETKIGEEQPKLKRHIAIINRQIDVSNNIINNLLNFAKPIKLSIKSVDIPALIDEVLNSLELMGIQVVKRFSPELPLPEADKEQLRQVFINIITNAAQAMRKGGRLTISVKESKGKLSVRFADTGSGISQEKLAIIFEPFFTTRARGIGLGLALCQRIMEKHRGSIKATSKKGKGSIFTLLLPIKAEKD